jgi:hypothetical protein
MIKSSSYINFNDAEGCFIIEDSIHAVFAFSTSSLVLVVHRLRVGSLVTIVVLCISATFVNALQRSNSTAVEEAERIVGGQQAAIGEYPYFGTYNHPRLL